MSSYGEPPRGFSPATREWFSSRFTAPTPAQAQAWETIADGRNALVVAPTGSGKTLSAFLWSLDQLASRPRPSNSGKRCRVVYVSPLKALAYDVERNLRQPLSGITERARARGEPTVDVSVAMRTGDTTPSQRRAFARGGADILITTPESLYLLLTSAARDSLRGVETVIIDEVHALSGTKRGAHLALSLERLDALVGRDTQRVGLSATVRPLEETARFLGGVRPVEIVRPSAAKTIELSVEVTTPDLANLTEVDESGKPSVWPSVIRRLHDLVVSHRSTLVFANSRLLTERICAWLNEYAQQHPPSERAGPAALMAQSPAAAGAAPVLARAHHGSMSREERLVVEEALKTGALPAVVATSSLELGIDMGAVDLVVQLGAPPSVASGLQRVGRAGHQVGEISRGVVLPTHRSDLLAAAVTSERILDGAIEELRVPRNPVDVLAQHVVSMVAMNDWPVAELAALVRRAASFTSLPESALRSVLDMLAGKYPSTAFAGLKPKLVWDRQTDRLTARRGAQRVAVANAGTIPDRGLYGVFLTDGGSGARVGELDEEMVYESRVGDVFLLGATSWRIDAISPDRVLVSPAAGQAARMPFWKGEDPGRPAELGRALGERVRQLSPEWTNEAQLNELAGQNLIAYVEAQREHAGAVCDDRTVVVERFRDELGDWRLVVHCLLGARVNRPWALAIAARLRQRYHLDAHVLATDDGIVARVPDMDVPPGAELVRFSPDDIAKLVTGELENSPLFAARFRECAARALLLPRHGVGRRQPLWQQRQRAGQLFDTAHGFADFPITAEAARECLEDYFDLPELTDLMRGLASGAIQAAEVTTPRASPFAQSLLMAYTASHMYSEDEPLAERRVAALNSGMLEELLGAGDQSLEPGVVATAERWLRWRDGRELAGAEDAAELLRVLGDVSETELCERGIEVDAVADLAGQDRAVSIELAGQRRWIAAEDAARYRDGLGVTLPERLPEAFTAPVTAPLDDLVARYARTHGPFTTASCAARFGVAEPLVEAALHRLDADGVVRHGHFTGDDPQWCGVEVLRLLRRRTLEALRAEIEPVPPERYTAFLADWQQVGGQASDVETLADMMEQLQGVALPASAWESLVLPARLAEYNRSSLDELTASGELLWCGSRALGGHDGWVSFAYADSAPLLFPEPDESILDAPHRRLLEALDEAPRLLRELPGVDNDLDATLDTLWDLVWAGWISNDSLAALRASLAPRRAPVPPSRTATRRPGRSPARRVATRRTPPTGAGRWYRLPIRDTDPTRRLHAATASLLDRHGLVVRGAAAGRASGFAGQYPVLAAMEDKGTTRRGYFVSGMGAAQFAEPGAVDRLRAAKESGTYLLAACDPANPYGAGLPWPGRDSDASGHRPGRKAGAVVIMTEAQLAWYLERGGRTLLTYTGQPERHSAAAQALTTAIASGQLPDTEITHTDGEPVNTTRAAAALLAAGFRQTPKGLRYR